MPRKKREVWTIECKAKDLPKTQFPHKYMKYIIGDKLEKTVMYVYRNDKRPSSTNAGREACKYLNRNLVFKQLDILIPYTDKRQIFYYVDDDLNGKIDLKGATEQTKFVNMEASVINVYIKKLHITMYAIDPIKYSYWGFTQDYIEVHSKPTVGFYLPKINPETDKLKREFLDEENIKKALSVPFYLLVGEKMSIIEPVGCEMIKRGFNVGYYIMDLGGNAVTEGNKILRMLSKIKNVNVFVLHDGDLDGLQILFDMTKHNKMISVGINPEFLEHCNIEIEDVKVEYSNEKQHDISHERTKTALKKIKDNIDAELYQKYKDWMEFSYFNKIELNSIVKLREEEDMYSCLVRDFCDYIEHIIVKQKWNLLRYTNFKPIDKISFKETEIKTRYDGTFYQSIPLYYTTISYTNRPTLKKVYPYVPHMGYNTEEALKRNITKDDEGFGKVYQDIIEMIDSYKLEVDSKLYSKKLTINQELNDKHDKLYESIIDENPDLFDVDWDALKDTEKINQFNNAVVSREIWLAQQITHKYITYREALKNYKGSIKEPVKPVNSKKVKLAKFYNKRKKLHSKKILCYNEIIQTDLEETEEYKTAESIADNLQEYSEVVSIDIGDTMKKFKSLKEEMKKSFERWYKELSEILEIEDEEY